MDTTHFFVAVLLLAMSVPIGLICVDRAIGKGENGRWVQAVALVFLACLCVATMVTVIREFAR